MEATYERDDRNLWADLTDALAMVWRGMTRWFGCWHLEMSRPFTRGDESYRVCLKCGTHRRFDLKTWETVGPYYLPGETDRFARAALAHQHHWKKEKSLTANKRGADRGEPWVMRMSSQEVVAQTRSKEHENHYRTHSLPDRFFA